jgi:hypothetical protein
MNQTDTQLTAQLADLVSLTAKLKSMLANDRAPEALTETCAAITTTAAAMTAIGPIDPQPAGLYGAWYELVLVLGEAKNRELAELPLAALDGAIEAVRTLRRTFGIAPGGA